MDFQVYQAAGSDARRWAALIRRLKFARRDLHYLPEYAAIYQQTYQYQPYLACYREEDQFIIQPFVKRNLNGLPFLKEQGIEEPKYDIANVYGFGGPLSSSDNAALTIRLAQKFNRHFQQYCRAAKIASEFAACHPLLDNHQLVNAMGLEALYQKQVVYLDLLKTEAQLWKELRKGHKSSVTKARQKGVTIAKVDPTPENLKIFTQLYNQTMQRNNAAGRWLFPDCYYRSHFDYLGPERCSLFFAVINDRVAAASMFMHDFSTIYYHFSGSDSQFYEYCPNNLLLYSVALWAKGQGYLRFHLGGGVTNAPDDSLFLFKAGFAKTSVPFYFYYRVHHQDTYGQLCELKKAYERKTAGAELDSDYFPLYRR
jgi:hypothetical protein